jgi:hypothetical protein
VTAAVTLGWLVALVVLLSVRSALPSDAFWWVWTCVAGVAMGLFGLWYVPFLKRHRARMAAARAVQPRSPRESVQSEAADPQSAGGQASSGYESRDSGSKTVSSTETPGKSTRS